MKQERQAGWMTGHRSATMQRFRRCLTAWYRHPFAAATTIAVASMALAMTAQESGVDMTRVLRDPEAVLGGSFGTGAVSLLGSLLWAASATVLLFTAVVLRQLQPSANEHRPRLLTGSGLLAAFLGVDDTFVLHERVTSDVLEGFEFLVLVYAVATTVWLRVARPFSATRFRATLGLGLVLLAGSAVVDLVGSTTLAGPQTPRWAVAEDSMKFGGIVAFAIWSASVSYGQLLAVTAGPHSRLRNR